MKRTSNARHSAVPRAIAHGRNSTIEDEDRFTYVFRATNRGGKLPAAAVVKLLLNEEGDVIDMRTEQTVSGSRAMYRQACENSGVAEMPCRRSETRNPKFE
jgi:hypothetical protein